MDSFNYLRVLVILAIVYSQDAISQSVTIDSLLNRFDQYRQRNLQEKLYLHLDRPSYVAGETMWFKIYVTDATLHRPLMISSVAYVELVDRNNKSILQAKIRLDSGMGNGSIYIPTTLRSDNYTLRAYTSWMKNFDHEFFFTRSLCVINPFKSLEIQSSKSKEYWDAQFFPEGGNLVEGIESKVAFRVIKPDGKGADFVGFLVNQNNDTITRFKPLRFGIGHFFFTPEPDQSYKAIILDSLNQTQVKSLQKVLPKGFTLRVEDDSKQIHVSVKANLSGTTVTPAVYIFIHSRNIISGASFQILRDGNATFSLNRGEIVEGISHITVLDADLNPVCERLYFKMPDNLDINLKLNQSQFATRSLVKVDLNTLANDELIESNLSLTAFRVDSLSVDNGNIRSYFWLTSDLKGSIESPEFYFMPGEEVKIATDNLMLTHGWRRFRWSNILTHQHEQFNFLPEINGHIIKGRVKSQTNPMVFLTALGKKIQMYPSKSSHDGSLSFEMKKFHGLNKIVLLTEPNGDSILSYVIENPFLQQTSNLYLPPLEIDKTVKSSLLDRSVSLQVHDIFNSDSTKYLHSINVDSIPFYGKGDETYFLDSYTRFTVMEEVMREYVPGVLVRKRKDGFHFAVVDDENKTLFSESPLILLDGVPIFDEDDIMKFNPLEVKKLEVIKRRWHLGPTTFSGIVSFSTYNGDMGSFKLSPQSLTLDYEGLQEAREFYSPMYESQVQRESRIPDQRNLLIWNPGILTDFNGKSQIEFFTSDVPGEYRIIVEGMTKTGKIGSTTTLFTVR